MNEEQNDPFFRLLRVYVSKKLSFNEVYLDDQIPAAYNSSYPILGKIFSKTSLGFFLKNSELFVSISYTTFKPAYSYLFQTLISQPPLAFFKSFSQEF